MDDEVERVRAERDPLVRARLATELMATYAQRSQELARLRQAAIRRTLVYRGPDATRVTMTEVAQTLGLTRSRISQIYHCDLGDGPAEW